MLAHGRGRGHCTKSIDYFVNRGAATVNAPVGSLAIIKAQPEMLAEGTVGQEVTVGLNKTRYQDRIGESSVERELRITELCGH